MHGVHLQYAPNVKQLWVWILSVSLHKDGGSLFCYVYLVRSTVHILRVIWRKDGSCFQPTVAQGS